MKEIFDGVFAINMFEKIDIDVLIRNNECFFVCDVIDDVNFIKALAKFLQKEGMRNALFLGKFGSLWQETFDQADMENIGFQNLAALMFDNIMLTATSRDTQDFANSINFAKNVKKNNIYLFYDDQQIFNDVVKEIK